MYAIGIDVGGTNLKAGLVGEDGTILASVWEPLYFTDGEAFAATLARMTKEVMGEHPVSSVGIGIPGAVEGGKVLFTANIPMKNLPLENLFRRHLDLPVYLANDADCAAAAEYLYGSGRGTRDFITVTLGTGIGGGLILGGKLHRGKCCAGEVGCMVIDRENEKGSWEYYASATGLVRMAEAARTPDSLLWNQPLIGRTVFAAAEQGDETALAVAAEYDRYLGLGLTNLVDILQPERIAIGGGVSAAPEKLLLEPVRQYVHSHCYGQYVGHYPQIVRASLGNDAGIVGAAQIRSLL